MAEADGVCGVGGRISCPERLRTKVGLLTFVYWFEMSRNMNRKMIEDALFPGCPIRNVLARISDKWSLLVIYTLDKAGGGPMRFRALQRELPDISQKMLTVTLRTLEEDGYVRRTVYPEVPPRVEYVLTDRAKSLLPHVNGLLEWALANMDAVMADRKMALTRS